MTQIDPKKIESLLYQKKRQLARQLKHQALVDKAHGPNGIGYTYYGGWTKGYLDGMVSQLHNQVDDLMELLGLSLDE